MFDQRLEIKKRREEKIEEIEKRRRFG